jgi:hypothetical protein
MQRTVGDAVDHDCQSFHPRLPAGRAAVVKEDRSGAVFRQLPFDLPDQLLAPFLASLGRLAIDQLVHLRIAVTVIVQFAAAPVIQVEVLVGIGFATHRTEPNGVVLSDNLGKPIGGVDHFELAVDVHLLLLVDHDHGRASEEREVSHRHLDLEPQLPGHRRSGDVGKAPPRQLRGNDRDGVVDPGFRRRGGCIVQEDRRRLREGQRQHDRLQHRALCADAPEDRLGGDERRRPRPVPEQPLPKSSRSMRGKTSWST